LSPKNRTLIIGLISAGKSWKNLRKQNLKKILNDFKATTSTLVLALRSEDLDKAHEAVSILLMHGMSHLGPDHAAMKQFMPVWSRIEAHISEGKIENALGQAQLWSRQLDEVITLVENAGKNV